MIPGINEPLPFWDALVTKAGEITDTWTKYLEQVLVPQIRSGTLVVGRYTNGDTPLTDALSIVALEETVPNTGAYVLQAAIQVVGAAAVASTLALTVTWTSNGIVQTETFATLVDGTDTTHQGTSFPIIADGGTPVSISTAYTSNPANDLEYNLNAALLIVGLPGQTA